MTRAAYIWRHGECYCWDPAEDNWFPTACPPPNTGLCGSVSGGGGDGARARSARGDARGDAVAEFVPVRRSIVRKASEYDVRIRVTAPPDASAMALDFEIPRGWTVGTISDGGEWDEGNRKVKWGPFFDEMSRTVTFTVSGTTLREARETGRPVEVRFVERKLWKGFDGTVAFDGFTQPIEIR
jgi:hypothetical protein